MVLNGRNSFSVLLFCLTASVFGQEKESFENLSLDRPDVSNLPITVRPGHFQVEMGGEFGKSSYLREYHLPNFLLRTGITRKTELRAGITSLRMDSMMNSGSDKVILTSLSVKYRFVEEKGARPAIAIQPEIFLPFGNGTDISRNEAKVDLLNYSVLLLFNNTVHEEIFINYNTGVFWNNQSDVDYLISVSTSYAHTHKLGYFLETYSLSKLSKFSLSFDGGLTYLIFPRLLIDVYFGNRMVSDSRYWFYGTGIGFRIDRDNLKRESFQKTGIHH